LDVAYVKIQELKGNNEFTKKDLKKEDIKNKGNNWWMSNEN
jgi:hypothetical protein